MLVLVIAPLIFAEPTYSGVAFQAAKYVIEGLPHDFRASCWTKADVEGLDKPDLALAGLWKTGSGWQSGAFIVRAGDNDLKVVHAVFQRVTPLTSDGFIQGRISSLTACDLDHDGRDELFAFRDRPALQRMAQWEGGSFVEDEAPFPALLFPVLAWFDYDGDGWIDLFLTGSHPVEGKEHQAEPARCRLFRNERGHLTATDIAFDLEELVDSAHVLDFDEDGRPDLLLGIQAALTRFPVFNRVFLNRVDHFDEVQFPMVYGLTVDQLEKVQSPVRFMDKLLGVSEARIASADLDNNGTLELFVSGCWDTRMRLGSIVTIVYEKIRDSSGKKHFLTYSRKYSSAEIPNILGAFTIEDFDGDGDKDILAAGLARGLRLSIVCLENVVGDLRRVTAGPWTAHQDQPLGEGYGDVVVPWDLDGNQLLDFICFPQDGDKEIMALRNTSSANTSGPLAPRFPE